jgi:hypothetical protein
MPLALRTVAESTPTAGISPAAGRPLFVPPGFEHVQTGPTTRAELDRLIGDADDASEVSGVRVRESPTPSLWLRALAALGFVPR